MNYKDYDERMEEEERRQLEAEEIEDAKIFEEKKKLKRIKLEIKKLGVMFAEIDGETKKTVHSLIENAAFMAITLEDLQKTINRDGPTDRYQNGENQFGIKKSAAVEVYNTMIKNHVTVMKSLTDMIPKKQPAPKVDELDGFIKERDD